MNNYRNQVKKQTALLSVAVLALIAVQVLAFMGIIKPVAASEHSAGVWNGFIAGAAMGMTVFFIIGIIRSIAALRNEKSLKKLFNAENDERLNQICQKGQSVGSRFAVALLLIAGIISGYFNITVFATCIACVFIFSVSMALGKLYYSRKM